MDSLTQFVLGAAVSTACLGKALGPRKAALVGGLLGTLPDLDVFIPFDDPIDSFVYHRGWSHSIFVHALATPVIGEGLRLLFKKLRDHRWLAWATVFLCLSTHAIIDAMTVYGTRLFWPLYPDPVGVGSIFIIDPLYTLPLLIVVVWALCKKNWSSRLRSWVTGALVFSTAYLGVGVVLQRHVESQARQIFQDEGVPSSEIFAIAAPFNILVWKVIGLGEDRYDNLYYSLLDGAGPPEIYVHPRHPELIACLQDSNSFRKLDWFSRGFFRTDLVGNKVVMSDLRMGLTPGYAFRFAIGELDGDGVKPIAPQRHAGLGRIEAGDWDWFLARLQGKPGTREAEVNDQYNGQSQTAGQCGKAGAAAG
jgi:inner membrane protein